MSRFNEPATRREVSSTSLSLLHMNVAHYYLRGAGGRAFDPPPKPELAALQLAPADAAEILSAKRRRLEALGNDVGTRLVERFTLERDRMEQHLEVVKFVCKDFWERVFRKQIDVLRTNHRGLYVLTDNDFGWLASVSDEEGGDGDGSVEDYVVFPCGMICGALTRLGVKCRVTAEIIPLPTSYKCSFNVQVIQSAQPN